MLAAVHKKIGLPPEMALLPGHYFPKDNPPVVKGRHNMSLAEIAVPRWLGYVRRTGSDARAAPQKVGSDWKTDVTPNPPC